MSTLSLSVSNRGCICIEFALQHQHLIISFFALQLYTGNLYYALTHAPEPLTEEYSHALSWEAATERFAAAGSVSVAEAEAMDKALKSAEAGIDVRINVYLAHLG